MSGISRLISRTEQEGTLREQVAEGLRRARGYTSQIEFCERLRPILGRALAVNQWGRYERGQTDAPAFLVLAAAEASHLGLFGMFRGRPAGADPLKAIQVELEDLHHRIDRYLIQPDCFSVLWDMAQRADARPLVAADLDALVTDATAVKANGRMEKLLWIEELAKAGGHPVLGAAVVTHYKDGSLSPMEVTEFYKVLQVAGAYRNLHGGDPVTALRGRWERMAMRMARDLLAKRPA